MRAIKAIEHAEPGAPTREARPGIVRSVLRAPRIAVQAFDSVSCAAVADPRGPQAEKVRYGMRRLNPNVCRRAPARTKDRR
jgi:hypothetical protein